MLVDSHCHLTDAGLHAEAGLLVDRARSEGVSQIVTVGTAVEDARHAAELAQRLDGVFAAVGIHPHTAAAADADSLRRIADLAGRPRVVAIGETGLDYHYDNSPRGAQRDAFQRQLELAHELRLPVVVHSRDAEEDTAAMIRAAGGRVRGVLHCFTGGPALLDAALGEGWLVSFAGIVSFRKFEGADLVRAVPADRLLIETDSPYLAPVPRRGRRNEPAFVRYVAEAVASLRGEAFDDVAAYTTRNARKLFGLPDPVADAA